MAKPRLRDRQLRLQPTPIIVDLTADQTACRMDHPDPAHVSGIKSVAAAWPRRVIGVQQPDQPGKDIG
jgi:hypothetical protein